MGDFVDARTLESGTEYRTDVCVVGAGAAGITLARSLAASGREVLLAESGNLDYEQETQELYLGRNTGFKYYPLETCRLRYFGGTTNHWAGYCRPLDPIDFERRDWVPHSGWPFGRETLDPFYVEAHELCQIGPFNYSEEEWSNSPAFCCFEHFDKRIFQRSPPTKFGQVYRDEVMRSPRVTPLLHANLDRISLEANGASVRELQFVTLAGTRFRVRANSYVLAAGGLENPRLLLLSRDIHKQGVGNQHDLVGRFFMDHPIIKDSCHVLIDHRVSGDFFRKKEIRGVPVHGIIASSARSQAEAQLLNSSAGLRRKQETSVLVSAARYAHNINESDEIDRFTADMASLLFNDSHLWYLNYFGEQAPNPDSRVTLSDTRDALGQQKIDLHWKFSEIDRHSFVRFHQLLASDVGTANFGRVRTLFEHDTDSWAETLVGGFHHIGTTRMHDNPRQGVVDRNCRVHGVANLYVAGSSVFPTCGYANPTLTIVALALRLADHLGGRAAV